MYLVRTKSPLGYLYWGRVVQSEWSATAYSSPSAAELAKSRAIESKVCKKAEIIKMSKRSN